MEEQHGLRKRQASEKEDTIVEQTVQFQISEHSVHFTELKEKDQKVQPIETSAAICAPASLNRIGKLLILASAVASVAFWFISFSGHPFEAKTLLKWLSIAFIIAMVVEHCNIRRSRQEFWFVIALVFHSLGDVIIAQGGAIPSIPG